MFLLDANVFIEAKNFYYRFEIFPAVWAWLDREQEFDRLASVLPVAEELIRGNDELADWATERKGGGWFLPVDDEETQRHFSEILRWVLDADFTESAKAEFMDGGDPWLIAKARSLSAAVVTQEIFAPEIRRKVKIPNVCKAFDIEYMNTFDLLKSLGARF